MNQPPPTCRPQLTAEQVFRDHAARVYNLARRMLRHDADAEDVTQDVLLQVVRKLDTFRGEANFPTWLHKVTVNAALAHRRKRAAREGREAKGPVEQLLDAPDAARPRRRTAAPEAVVLNRELRWLIERAIAELPALYSDVFILSDVEGIAAAEVADLLGLSLPAVKSRLHRGRLWLRDALAAYLQEAA